MDTAEPAADHVDLILRQWSRELPDTATDGAAILARARRITLRVRRDIEAVFERHGLDTGQFDVLATLRRAGPPFRLRPTELYRSLMISSGGLTDRLQRLERAGLIRRRADDEDGRSLLVELTDTGRERIEAAFREDMAIENSLVAGLDPEERAALAGLLRRLALSIGA
ncbi:MAG TPA: MarR family transcriptional regulator [Stellaceae bacterium]|nr:MarR family transcriptional regulator [Stellaceae bacterium]